MFISTQEKEEIRISIRTLQAQMTVALEEITALKARKPVRMKKPKKAKTAIVRTPEAPWGYKKDGTPKKRPGRVKTEVTNEQSVPV